MADYEFTTLWRLAAPIGRVWGIIATPITWPQWWQGVREVRRVAVGDAAGVGNVYHFVFRGKLPYTLAFDMETIRSQPPFRLEGRASGELAGTGLWQLSAQDGVTSVRYDWHVHTSKTWMNLLAPLARPLFVSNHDAIMAWGGEGLARRLDAQLLR